MLRIVMNPTLVLNNDMVNGLKLWIIEYDVLWFIFTVSLSLSLSPSLVPWLPMWDGCANFILLWLGGATPKCTIPVCMRDEFFWWMFWMCIPFWYAEKSTLQSPICTSILYPVVKALIRVISQLLLVFIPNNKCINALIYSSLNLLINDLMYAYVYVYVYV